MVITLEDIGKRFGREWIFRGVNTELIPEKKYAITGPNGSGKSTLLKIISGGLTPTKGQLLYKIPHIRNPKDEHILPEIAFAAPYIQLIEEFTLNEMIEFHFHFKKMKVSKEDFLEKCTLKGNENKLLSHFSSGMRQRLKLSLAMMSDTKVLILDEPTSNLDEKGCAWYQQMVQEFSSNRLFIIGSNIREEYSFCDEELNIFQFKK